MKKPLVVLTGPTAVGKTSLSIELAKRINGSIISADSIQVYRYMDIGSAKIMPVEMQGIKHYLVDVLDPKDEFDIARFQAMAHEAMSEIYGEGKIPILVGGTGFYIQSILYEIQFEQEDSNLNYRQELYAYADANGSHALHEKLRAVDAKAAEQIHENNVKRVARALEFYEKTGKKISEHNEEQKAREAFYNSAYFVLNDEREKLYQKIDMRVDLMMENGLVAEVQSLLEKGYTRDLVSMQGLGYKEICSYLAGECSLNEAVTTIKRDTRHFAKRQLTWFRREQDVIWINKNQFEYDEEAILNSILETLKLRKII